MDLQVGLASLVAVMFVWVRASGSSLVVLRGHSSRRVCARCPGNGTACGVGVLGCSSCNDGEVLCAAVGVDGHSGLRGVSASGCLSQRSSLESTSSCEPAAEERGGGGKLSVASPRKSAARPKVSLFVGEDGGGTRTSRSALSAAAGSFTMDERPSTAETPSPLATLGKPSSAMLLTRPLRLCSPAAISPRAT